LRKNSRKKAEPLWEERQKNIEQILKEYEKKSALKEGHKRKRSTTPSREEKGLRREKAKPVVEMVKEMKEKFGLE